MKGAVRPAGPLSARWLLPAKPASVGEARRRVDRTLITWGLRMPREARESLSLVVSELVTNGVTHGGSGTKVTVHVAASRVRHEILVEVYDLDQHLPTVQVAQDEDENGRGMFLVDAYTSGQWGSEQTEEGKRVWALMPLPLSPRELRRRQLHERLKAALPQQPTASMRGDLQCDLLSA